MPETKDLDPRTAKRKEALISAARKLFTEHGLAGTTLEMITAEAGGSRRTIYELFGNKDGIFEAVVRDGTKHATSIIGEIQFSNLELRESLIEFGTKLMTFLTAADTIKYFRLLISEIPRFPHVGKVFYETGSLEGRRILAAYFTAQIAAGNWPKSDPEQAAIFLLSLIKSDLDIRQFTYSGWKPRTHDLQQHVTNAVDMFLRGYGVASAKPLNGE